jgi:ABC-2 type transport system permease protein
MLANVFLKTLRDMRHGLIGWGVGIVLMVTLESALWPSINHLTDLDKLIANYPQGLRKLFNLDAMSTGQGFMNAELFSLVLPGLFITYAVGKGARLIAGEEQAGTLEMLLVAPLSTTRILLEKAAALVVSVVALGACLLVTLTVASAIFGLDIGLAAAATGSLAIVLISAEFGCLALGVGAASGRRVVALATAGAAAIAGYLLYAAGLFVDSLRGIQGWSPFDQAIADGPLGARVTLNLLWMILAAVAFIALAAPAFHHRDITTAN